MKYRARFALGVLVFLSAAAAGFADGEKPAASNPPGDSAGTASIAGTPASTSSPPSPAPAAPAPPATAAPAPQTSGDEVSGEAPTWDPMPAASGNPGLLTLETGETLSKGSFDVVTGFSKISRMPGSSTIFQIQPAFAVGIKDWLSISFEFDAWNYIHVDTPAELSLSPVNALNPQYIWNQKGTIYPSVLPVSGSLVRPAYLEEFPFAGKSRGGVGQVDLGFKLGVLSQRRGNWMSLSVSNDFYIPTQHTYSSLIGNQTQNGRLSYAIGLEGSKALLHGSCLFVLNGTYEVLPSAADYNVSIPGYVSPLVLQQANQLRVGGGFLMFPGKRIQVLTEYDGVIFVGNAIPNTTFGARDPVDSVYGLRLYPWTHMAVDLGYRYNLNFTSDRDRNGFELKMAFASWRKKPAPPPAEDRLVTSCSVGTPSISAGSTDIVEVTVNASDSAGHPLTYGWTASGGEISGIGPFARWKHAGVAPGSYTLSVRVDDGAGHTSSCSAVVTITP